MKNNHLVVPGSTSKINHDQSENSLMPRRRSTSQVSPTKSFMGEVSHEHMESRHHHLMPRPSPRKLSKARDVSESPDGKRFSMVETSHMEEGGLKQKRKINKKILKEI